MEVFKWYPQIALDVEYEQAIKEVQFGDGYEQIKSVDDALAYVLELQESGMLPSVVNTEIERKKEVLMRHIMENRKNADKVMRLKQ